MLETGNWVFVVVKVLSTIQMVASMKVNGTKTLSTDLVNLLLKMVHAMMVLLKMTECLTEVLLGLHSQLLIQRNQLMLQIKVKMPKVKILKLQTIPKARIKPGLKVVRLPKVEIK